MFRKKILLILACMVFNTVQAQNLNQRTNIELSMERMGFVDIHCLDSTIFVDLMYTRADNFTGQVLYTELQHAYLHPEAAKALLQAQKYLKKRRPDLSLKVYDAARPMSVQQKMKDVVKGTDKDIYVSHPKNGGGLHNYGLAVDVTLCWSHNGDTLDMGTEIDHLGPFAHIDREQVLMEKGIISQQAFNNRQLLRQVMREAGFKTIRTEWWHYNFRSRSEAKARYQPIM